MRAVVAELPGLKSISSRKLEAAQAASSDHVRGVGGLPDVDPELPENAEIAFNIVGMGNVVQRARPVRESGGEGGALRDRLISRRTPNDLAGAGETKPDRDRRFLSPAGPAASGRLGTILIWYDMRSMTSVSDRASRFPRSRGRGGNPVRHALGKGGIAKALPLQPEILLGDEGARRDRREAEPDRRLHDRLALFRSRHHDGLPRRLCPALAAGIDVWIAVGNRDVGETRPPVSADEAAVGLMTFELIDHFEEGQ